MATCVRSTGGGFAQMSQLCTAVPRANHLAPPVNSVGRLTPVICGLNLCVACGRSAQKLLWPRTSLP